MLLRKRTVNSRAQKSPGKKSANRAILTLSVIVIVMSGRFLTLTIAVLAIAGGIGAGFWQFAHRAQAPANTLVEAQIGTANLLYPHAYARFGAGRTGGMLDQLELAAHFPDFVPVPANAPATATDSTLFLSLAPADTMVSPDERMSKLYARFLEPDVWSDEGGLLMRRFRAASPYDREELYFAPPDGRAFSARCPRPAQPPDGLPDSCLATFRHGSLDVSLRFARALIPQWERLADGTRALAARFANLK